MQGTSDRNWEANSRIDMESGEVQEGIWMAVGTAANCSALQAIENYIVSRSIFQ
ncbi:hypothetical protein GJ744_010921 [Endocarpon pusillum]|uniref:Uncharacterized protein n=1 Tax=Endocarpon pusillum TaxID=364733 RepID=A0A8H7ADH2_9EURO|nr:hypothetical protein GJ744_010921 [Endocarpon pusillum]